MDPGRKKIEWRDPEFISVGDLIVSEHGTEWEVTGIAEECFHVKRTLGLTESASQLTKKAHRVRVQR